MIKEGRRVGNTTRVVDKCIQEFFENGYAICKDHIDISEAHYEILIKVVKRLELEHPYTKYDRILRGGVYNNSISENYAICSNEYYMEFFHKK